MALESFGTNMQPKFHINRITGLEIVRGDQNLPQTYTYTHTQTHRHTHTQTHTQTHTHTDTHTHTNTPDAHFISLFKKTRLKIMTLTGDNG